MKSSSFCDSPWILISKHFRKANHDMIGPKVSSRSCMASAVYRLPDEEEHDKASELQHGAERIEQATDAQGTVVVVCITDPDHFDDDVTNSTARHLTEED